jgi:hypothetical protein
MTYLYDQPITYSYEIKRKLLHIVAHKGTLTRKSRLPWRAIDKNDIIHVVESMNSRMRWDICPEYRREQSAKSL